MTQTNKAVKKGIPPKTAFDHYFGIDKKGNVNVANFQPLSATI